MTCRVELPIDFDREPGPQAFPELDDSEIRGCLGRPIRTWFAALALKRALAGLAKSAGIEAGPRDFSLTRGQGGVWVAQRWPGCMGRPLLSVSHSRSTAVALAASQEWR